MERLITTAAFSLAIICLNLRACSSHQIGGPCLIEDDCYDIRLYCVNSTCLCSRFYFWDGEIEECNLNITELKVWLSNLQEEIDLSERLNSEAISLFYHLGFAGILAMTLGLVGGASCVILFCVLKPKTKSDHEPPKNDSAKDEGTGPTFIPPAAAFQMIV